MKEQKNYETNQKMGFGEDCDRYLEFNLGHEEYALPLLMVKEVISVPETTPIPRAPSHFLGVMNLRGQIISIIDLRKKLSIPKAEKLDEEAVIILDVKGMNIGIVVDSINKVLPMPQSQINQVPEIESQVNAKFIQGIFRKEESLTMLIDVLGLLDLKDMETLKGNKAA